MAIDTQITPERLKLAQLGDADSRREQWPTEHSQRHLQLMRSLRVVRLQVGQMVRPLSVRATLKARHGGRLTPLSAVPAGLVLATTCRFVSERDRRRDLQAAHWR